ncbi:MAG: acylphosphatase [Thermoproteota archaeon]
MLKKKAMIKGEKVQDVGYRLFLLEAAESLGLKGFQARNVEDYVEFLVEGEDDSVSRFLDFARRNYPEFAKVKELIEEDYEGYVMPIDSFYRNFSLNQLVKIVDIGINMLGKQDILINEVRDLRNDLKAFMEERFRRIEMEIARIKERIGME